jgi:hypothetical protein
MLVSPLMGPILGIVFGLSVGDSKLWRVGLKTEAIGLSVAILTGFVVGLCTTWSETKWGSSTSFPIHEMRSRLDKKSILYIKNFFFYKEVIFVAYGLVLLLLYHQELMQLLVFLAVMLEVLYEYYYK